MSASRGDPYDKLCGKHVLIVEDHAHVAELLARLLNEYDHASCATSGKAALEEIDREPPDIILIDVTLSDMSGLDVVRAVRQNQKTRHIPILAMSGKPGERSSCLAAGCDDFILKPFGMRTLLNRLFNLL
jgi:DNA-binding response OmpR family regulator